jgi:regulator of ribonuclease activity B
VLNDCHAIEVLAMGILTSLFGCGKGDSRFVSEAAFRENAAKQVAMTPETLKQLGKYGVTREKELKLEFFFYTDREENASALSKTLSGMAYSAESKPSAHDKSLFVISGWTTKMPMDESKVVDWTRRMCQLGFDHDCKFDGWGTQPEQE